MSDDWTREENRDWAASGEHLTNPTDKQSERVHTYDGEMGIFEGYMEYEDAMTDKQSDIAAELRTFVGDVVSRYGEVQSIYNKPHADLQAAITKIESAADELERLREALAAFTHPDGLSSANLSRNLERARALSHSATKETTE
jgi:hypothetical protein